MEEYLEGTVVKGLLEFRDCALGDRTKETSIRYSHEKPFDSQFSQRGLRSSPKVLHVSEAISLLSTWPLDLSRVNQDHTFSTPLAARHAASANPLLARLRSVRGSSIGGHSGIFARGREGDRSGRSGQAWSTEARVTNSVGAATEPAITCI